jgi:ABC-type xylose transport system permease subunit
VKHPIINGVVVLGAAIALIAGYDLVPVAVAAIAGWLILRGGVLVLGSMARPIPEPPPAGELRKVKIAYRCEICGAEVRMTVAPDADPDPPRHCQDDMTLMAPVE